MLVHDQTKRITLAAAVSHEFMTDGRVVRLSQLAPDEVSPVPASKVDGCSCLETVVPTPADPDPGDHRMHGTPCQNFRGRVKLD